MQTIRCPACGMSVGDSEASCTACGADVRIWVSRDGQVWGPFDLATVRRGRSEGRIVGSDMVCVGSGPWTAASSFDYTPALETTRPVPEASSPAPTVRLASRILLITLALCVVAGGWAYYTWSTAREEVNCRQNLTSVGLALKAYGIAHKGTPAVISPQLPNTLATYLPPTREWWTCPASGKPFLVTSATAPTGKQPVAWDTSGGKTGPHHGKWHVLYADGSVGDVTAEPPGGVPVVLPAPAAKQKPKPAVKQT